MRDAGTSTSEWVVVVPVKRLDRAKTRLSTRPAPERRALALNAFARYVYPDAAECRSVIELVAATPGLAVDTLLSAFPAARRIFIYRGLAWLMKMDSLRFPQ